MRSRTNAFAVVTVLGAVFLLLPAIAHAQQYLIHRYDDKEQIPSLAVTGVEETPEGAMLLSTRAGLVRYDGFRWEPVPLPDHKRPHSIRHIRYDRLGRLWTLELASPFTIHSFVDGAWTHHTDPPHRDWGWDVVAFDAEVLADGSTFLAAASHRKVLVWVDGAWSIFSEEVGLENIRRLVIHRGRLYVASGNGLLVYDRQEKTFRPGRPEGMPSGPVHTLAAGQALWVVGSDWIGKIQDDAFTMVATGLAMAWARDRSPAVAEVGPAGGLFFGDYLNLYHYHPLRGLRRIQSEEGLVGDGATDLLLDREKNLWVGNFRGISKVVRLAIQSFDQSWGLAADEVTSVLQRTDGSMILGHPGALTFLDPDPRTMAFFRPLPGNGRVMSMAEDADGAVWLAADKWGLGRLDPDGSLRWFDEDDGLEGQVFAVLVDSRDKLWLGGTQGLLRREGEGFREVGLIDPDPNAVPFIRSLREAPDGSLLASTGMLGVFRVQDGRSDRWSHQGNGLIRSTFDTYALDNGEFWVGTSAGLCRVEKGRLLRTAAPDPVVDRPVYCILRDRDGVFWFGTDEGVFRWDGESMTRLSSADGLPGREFNRDGLVQVRDGRIWMGTDRGLAIYDPYLDFPRTAPPLLHLGRPLVDGMPLDTLDGARISPSHFELVVPFTGISFLDEERIEFRSWLEGLEPDWQPYAPHPAARIRYTRLAPGEYRLHLQARNAAGVVSSVISTETFVVEKPWRQSAWFLLVMVLTGLVFLGGITALLAGRRYQASLQKEVRTRTRELQQSEAAVRSESQRLLSVLGSISDGVLALDEDLRVVLSNPTAQAILGRDGTEIAGQPLSGVMPLEPPLLKDGRLVDPQHDQGDLTIPTFVYRQPGGQARTLELTRMPLNTLEDSRRGWVLAFRDITERLRLQQESFRTQQLESLGLLAGGIAHDFNNLLTIMLGNLSLVEDSAQLEDDENYRLERMRNAADRARDLAEQLLTFAKGGQTDFHDVDLGLLVRQAVSFALSGSRVKSRLDIDKTLWRVTGDPVQLNQVVQNLVINAVQAMPEGGIMTVKMSNVWSLPGPEGPRPGVCLEVMDEGQGIEARDMERIFNPYFTTKGQGSGLGLTIAHSIVTNHGGLIEAESERKRGTVVRVILPAAEKSTEPDHISSLSRLQAGARVLVLDDEKDVLILTEQMLRQFGMPCVGVVEGREAVETFARALGQNRPFSVFIADLTVPGGMGGVEALAKIRELDPTVSAIVISGYSNDPVLANYEQYGFDAVIRKPFELDSLAAGLVEAMERGAKRKK